MFPAAIRRRILRLPGREQAFRRLPGLPAVRAGVGGGSSEGVDIARSTLRMTEPETGTSPRKASRMRAASASGAMLFTR